MPYGHSDGGIAPQSPYYLFVFANYDMVRGRSIIKKICKSDPNAGVGALLLFDNIYNLPQECGMIVEVQGSGGKAYPRERANDIVFFEIETLKHNECPNGRHTVIETLRRGIGLLLEAVFSRTQ